MVGRWRHGIAGVGLAACLLACGSSSSSPGPGTGGGDAGGGGVAGAGGASACVATGPPSGPSTIYLAFDGITIQPAAEGQDDATVPQSSILTEETTLPPFLADDPNRLEVRDTLVADLEQVMAELAVTITTEPPTGDHILFAFAGIDDPSGSLGLVPRDCGNQVRNDVGIFFELVANPAHGRYAMANEVMLALTAFVGMAKTNGPGHPCSCDPSSSCTEDELCVLTPDATPSFAFCPSVGDQQNELEILANVFGCR